jgi:hypothetical protein
VESIQDYLDEWDNDSTPDAVGKLFPAQTSETSGQLDAYRFSLGALFIALMIVRRGGPVNLDQIIRSAVPPLWSSAEYLGANPTMKQIAARLCAADLVMKGPATLEPPNSAKTSADIRDAIQSAFDAAMKRTMLLPTGLFAALRKPIHGVGFREFHVVKQHIRGYQLGEVARIENILRGETRSHVTKHTLSTETDTFNQNVTTTENDKELDTTDHVDIKNETDDQVKEDTKVDAGVHAQYSGPSYKLNADLTVGYDKSSDDTKKFASDVSKDVTQKATTKVTEQVTQSQTTKLIETMEETESQGFTNTSDQNTSGVYQWVEKVYLAQTFSLGKHMLFDLMVPEPGSSLLALATTPPPGQPALVPPDPLGIFHIDPITKTKVLDAALTPQMLGSASDAAFWIGKFQVTGVKPFPSDVTAAAKPIMAKYEDDSTKQGADTITIPTGYAANSVTASAAWQGNDGVETTFIDLTVANMTKRMEWDDGDNHPYANGTAIFNLSSPRGGEVGYSFITKDVDAL